MGCPFKVQASGIQVPGWILTLPDKQFNHRGVGLPGKTRGGENTDRPLSFECTCKSSTNVLETPLL